MIAILFMFIESILGRVFNEYLPGLIVNSLEDIRNTYWSIHLSQVLAIALALFLYVQKPKFGKAFLMICVGSAIAGCSSCCATKGRLQV